MNWTLILLSMLLISISELFGQANSRVDSLYSASLGRTMPISITVPSTYEVQNPIPILYLLHGHSQSHDFWLRRTEIE